MPSKTLTPFLGLAFLLVCSVASLAEQPTLPCETKLPLYVDKDNKPIWLDSQQLKDRAIHCEVPKMPPLASSARVEGQVQLAILVNLTGNVECIKVISGHPLFYNVGIEAAKKWKFKPMKLNGKALAFCGLLTFYFKG